MNGANFFMQQPVMRALLMGMMPMTLLAYDQDQQIQRGTAPCFR